MSAPAPPARDNRQTRYNTVFLARARELADAEWSNGQIRTRLQIEFGLDKPPSATTIRRWTEPGYVEQHRIWQLKSEKTPGKPGRFLTGDVLLALRVEDHLSFTDISAVVKRFFEVTLSEHQVRHRLNELGAPKNQNKTRVAS